DVKAAVDYQDPADPIELMQRCLDILSTKGNAKLSKAVVFKLKAKDAMDVEIRLKTVAFVKLVHLKLNGERRQIPLIVD
ncbi:hypothetical protein ACC709_36300, partial [Rhizobium ruizarguesonis]